MLWRKGTDVSPSIRLHLPQRSYEIVTAQHSDYTGREKLTSGVGITEKLSRASSLSWLFPSRASIPHFQKGPQAHDRTHLQARQERDAVRQGSYPGMVSRL